MLLASSYQIVVVSAPDQSVGTDLERFTVMRKFLLQIVVDGAVVEPHIFLMPDRLQDRVDVVLTPYRWYRKPDGGTPS